MSRVFINRSGSLRIVVNDALSFMVRYGEPRLNRIEALARHDPGGAEWRHSLAHSFGGSALASFEVTVVAK